MALLREDRPINDMVNLISYNDCVMSVHDVVDAVARTKSGKHDSYFSLTSDHVKLTCMPRVLRSLVMLSTSVRPIAPTLHGSTTDDLSSSTVLPIPKGKNLNYSDFTIFI